MTTREQPPDVSGPFLLRLPGQARHAGEEFPVPRGDQLPLLEVPINFFELGQADGAGDVGEPVVVANSREPVLTVGVHTVVLQASNLVGQGAVIGRDHPSLAGRNDLVAEETESSGITDRTDAAAFVLGTVGLGSVLENEQAVPASDLHDRVHVDRMAEQVDDDDPFRPRRDERLDLGRIHVPGLRLGCPRTPASRRSRRRRWLWPRRSR